MSKINSNCPNYKLGICKDIKNCSYSFHKTCFNNFACDNFDCKYGHGVSLKKREIISDIYNFYYQDPCDNLENCLYKMTCIKQDCNSTHDIDFLYREFIVSITKKYINDITAENMYDEFLKTLNKTSDGILSESSTVEFSSNLVKNGFSYSEIVEQKYTLKIDNTIQQTNIQQTNIQQIDSTIQQTNIQQIDSTIQQTNIQQIDSTIQQTNIQQIDSTIQQTNIQQIDSTIQQTNIQQIDSTIQQTNIQQTNNQQIDSTIQQTNIQQIDTNISDTEMVKLHKIKELMDKQTSYLNCLLQISNIKNQIYNKNTELTSLQNNAEIVKTKILNVVTSMKNELI